MGSCLKDSFRGKIYVTIDTEMDADIHWKKGKPVMFSSVIEGIPKFLRPIWNELGINPIYFVSPEVVENEDCCKILKEEIKKGAIIGAHLHPEYIEPEREKISDIKLEKFPCFGYSNKIEKAKIKNLKELIERKLDVEVEWYRAARFGADADTIRILAELGFKYDSSFTPFINWTCKGGPDHSKVSVERYEITDKTTHSKIIEFPVTITGKRWGILGYFLPDSWFFYSWLRPTHMTYLEEKNIIKKMKKKKVKDIVMMFHSMEIMTRRTPYVRTEWMRKYFLWRLRKTIGFAIKSGYISYSIY